jgi:hypothetical protein
MCLACAEVWGGRSKTKIFLRPVIESDRYNGAQETETREGVMVCPPRAPRNRRTQV